MGGSEFHLGRERLPGPQATWRVAVVTPVTVPAQTAGAARRLVPISASFRQMASDWLKAFERASGALYLHIPGDTDMLAKFIRDESGATAIEYGLIASLIAVAIIAAVELVGTNLTT